MLSLSRGERISFTVCNKTVSVLCPARQADARHVVSSVQWWCTGVTVIFCTRIFSWCSFKQTRGNRFTCLRTQFWLSVVGSLLVPSYLAWTTEVSCGNTARVVVYCPVWERSLWLYHCQWLPGKASKQMSDFLQTRRFSMTWRNVDGARLEVLFQQLLVDQRRSFSAETGEFWWMLSAAQKSVSALQRETERERGREGEIVMHSIKANKNNETIYSNKNVQYQWCASRWTSEAYFSPID